jgi:hypothetical protein
VLAPTIAFVGEEEETTTTSSTTTTTYSSPVVHVNSQNFPEQTMPLRVSDNRSGGNHNHTISSLPILPLAVLSLATVIVLLTENMMVLLGGKNDSSMIKTADFLEVILDSIFLGWMTTVMYRMARNVIVSSHHFIEYTGGNSSRLPAVMRWCWRSLEHYHHRSIIQFGILYTVFVTTAAIQTFVQFIYYVMGTKTLSEHFIYTFYKVHGANDLILLTGISIFLRPGRLPPQQASSPIDNDGTMVLGDSGVFYFGNGGTTIEGTSTTDYSLLLADDVFDTDAAAVDTEDERVSFEMTASSTIEPSTAQALL